MAGILHIRPAQARDADAIARTLLASAELHAQIDPERYLVPPLETMSARCRQPAARDSLRLVAELDGDVVGFLEARLERSPHPMHRELVYCHVAEIAVQLPYQNQGIGSELLAAAEDWGRQQAAEFASLEYHAANSQAAAFYERRMGYRTAAVLAIKRLG